MPKRRFDFSPPVHLILTNLPTIRQVRKMLDEKVVTGEIAQYLKYLADHLQETIPKIKTWQSEVDGTELYVFPGTSWQVVKDDHIALCVSMEQCVNPSFYSNEDDPFVGVYVPTWKHRQSFADRLKGLRIPGFEHISDYDNMDSKDEPFPLWSTIRLAHLVRQSRLDLDGLEKALGGRIRRLVAAEAKIAKLISAVRRK